MSYFSGFDDVMDMGHQQQQQQPGGFDQSSNFMDMGGLMSPDGNLDQFFE
jgi:hypothetical protein